MQARREPARAPGQTTFRAPPHPRVRYSTNWTTAPTQGYNLEENLLKIILFLCFRQILVWSATFDSHPAARGRSWIPLSNWNPGPGVLRGPRRGPGGPLKKI